MCTYEVGDVGLQQTRMYSSLVSDNPCPTSHNDFVDYESYTKQRMMHEVDPYTHDNGIQRKMSTRLTSLLESLYAQRLSCALVCDESGRRLIY